MHQPWHPGEHEEGWVQPELADAELHPPRALPVHDGREEDPSEERREIKEEGSIYKPILVSMTVARRDPFRGKPQPEAQHERESGM